MECIRCGGSGKIKKFKHVDNGQCFECNGKGYTLAENEIMIVYLDESKKEMDRKFCTRDTKQSVIMEHGRKIGAKSMKAVRSR